VRHKTLLGSSSRLYKFSQSLRKVLRLKKKWLGKLQECLSCKYEENQPQKIDLGFDVCTQALHI
jgi:hypothetical protein